MRTRLLVAVVALASVVPLQARAVGVVGASPNVEIVAQLPDAMLMGGRIVGRYLYATGTAGLRIYDLLNPEMPVPVGALPFEVFSNEDVSVSASRKLVLISNDQAGGPGGGLWVIDVLNPRRPLIKGFFSYQREPDFGSGVGHIANCINDCARYAYITGASDGKILIVDIADASNPKPVKLLDTPAGAGGGFGRFIHDVYTDPSGRLWITGTAGIAAVDASPGRELNPRVLLKTRKADNTRMNQFILHNSLLLDQRTLLVTEEDWLNPDRPDCKGGQEGSFQTWRIPSGRTGYLAPLDEWKTEVATPTFTNGRAPYATACSSHWFDLNKRKIVVVGWYQQGIRFLDVSNPRDIRQVGYYIAPWEYAGAGVSHALFAPGRDDIVYGMSLTSGLIVLKILNGGANAPTVRATAPAQMPLPSGVTFAPLRPDPRFGYACAIA